MGGLDSEKKALGANEASLMARSQEDNRLVL